MHLHIHNDACPTCGGPVKKCPHCGHVEHQLLPWLPYHPPYVPYIPPSYPYYPYTITYGTTSQGMPNATAQNYEVNA